jgi:hypothetical protein
MYDPFLDLYPLFSELNEEAFSNNKPLVIPTGEVVTFIKVRR